MMKHMKGLVDSTLREGSQTVGVSFTTAQKIAIARYLGRIGIEEVEVGIATPANSGLAELVSRCRAEAGIKRLGLWCRCREEDIACALGLTPDVLSLSIPVSDRHMAVRLRTGRLGVLGMVARAVSQARASVACVSLGLEDVTRAEPGWVKEIIKTACDHGVDRVRLADTVGIATPASIAALVREVRRTFEVEVGVHMHNDFGMATANALAALEAGAHWADVTVLGLGERAGNSRLEEVAGYLALQGGRPYDTTQLRPLAIFAGECAERSVVPHQPIVGSEIFACETGLHLSGLAQDSATYEPYAPSLVGAQRKFIYGGKIGRRGLIERLWQLGVQVQEAQLGRLMESFRRQCEILGRPLHDREVLRLVAGQRS